MAVYLRLPVKNLEQIFESMEPTEVYTKERYVQRSVVTW